MARLHLAHDARSTTDHYLTEQMQALAKLKEALFGDGLPLADDVRDDVGGVGTQS